MNRTSRLIYIAVLLFGSMAIAQEPSQPANPATGAAPQQQSGFPARGPQPKSADEFKAYQNAASATPPAAAEQAAQDFETKFPESELTGLLYERAMLMFEQAGAPDKTVAMGERAVKLLPNDPVVLVTLGTALIENTNPTDLDRQQRLDDGLQYCERALQSVDTMPTRSNAPPQAVENAKSELRAVAYSSIGAVYYDRKDFAKAEENFKKSIEVLKTRQDPATYLRLAMAQENEGKTAEALKSADQSVALAPPGTALAQVATRFKDNLAKKANSTAAPAATSSSPDGNTK